VTLTADHGAFDACADPTKFPAGFFHICTGSYDIPVAYVGVDGVYTNKAPGGVAYRCSFRVTEAAYFIERMIEVLAIEGLDRRLRVGVRRHLDERETARPTRFTVGDDADAGRLPTALIEHRLDAVFGRVEGEIADEQTLTHEELRACSPRTRFRHAALCREREVQPSKRRPRREGGQERMRRNQHPGRRSSSR
jgi:hypothetical protein